MNNTEEYRHLQGRVCFGVPASRSRAHVTPAEVEGSIFALLGRMREDGASENLTDAVHTAAQLLFEPLPSSIAVLSNDERMKLIRSTLSTINDAASRHGYSSEQCSEVGEAVSARWGLSGK